jgi:peroxiredoxin
MRNILTIMLVVLLAGASCKESAEKKFLVTGKLTNAKARMIYLERVPAATMQPMIEDSALIDQEGNFTLKAEPGESMVFNLTLDRSRFPIASIINDAEQVKLNITMSREKPEFTEKYDVEGSPASQQMKTFMIDFNNDLQKIFNTSRQLDSLQQIGAAESLTAPLATDQQLMADKIRGYVENALNKSNDPALSLFELGYYQSTANGAGFGLKALPNETVYSIVTAAAQKFPMHQSLAAIKNSFDQQMKKDAAANWVGRDAPDFALPDVNGKQVRLSSYRGKYVLVDFWASWCGPCRQENPNLVKAFQQFKDKNFTVLGVSLDRPGQKDRWLKAISDDKLAWTNVSDLQYWNSAVVPLYGFEGIPFNVLVDPQGKIIGQSLRGRMLEQKLGEVLQ